MLAGAICLLARAALLNVCNGRGQFLEQQLTWHAACTDAPQGVDCCRWHLAESERRSGGGADLQCSDLFFLKKKKRKVQRLVVWFPDSFFFEKFFQIVCEMLPRGVGEKTGWALIISDPRGSLPGKAWTRPWSILLI